MAEVPGERAEDRRVDRVELGVAQLRDQRERAAAGLLEPVGDLVLGR
jgi:hypothetical protein